MLNVKIRPNKIGILLMIPLLFLAVLLMLSVASFIVYGAIILVVSTLIGKIALGVSILAGIGYLVL